MSSIMVTKRWWNALTLFIICQAAHSFTPSNLTPVRKLNTVKFQPQQFQHSRHHATSTALMGKLWDRMDMEEDEQSYWYIINCVAGLEMDLLAQCRQRCEGMQDVEKFVVPTELKTRSHGANRMVTETKVKYLGYVFAKLRLCPQTYEAIQDLDLCRSWMGTVNQNGYKKLPPMPLALGEDEVEKFGLELEQEEEEEDDAEAANDSLLGIIVDSAEADAKQLAKAKAIEDEINSTYGELRVGDMVKVTAKGKFLGEDGIVKRLKGGEVSIRFFTYGTVYDHWMQPDDVRKMTDSEALVGLGGPVEPVTQQDFESPQGRDGGDRGPDARNRAVRNSRDGNRLSRDRRQDSNARQFGSDMNAQESRKNDDNWDWYQSKKRDSGETFTDDEWKIQPGRNDKKWEGARADGRVSGMSSKRQDQRDRRQQRQQQPENRDAQRAIDGTDDWSSFVSPVGAAPSGGNKGDSDDFFESLMSDLSKDLGGGSGSNGYNQNSKSLKTEQTSEFDDADFFASLASEISESETIDEAAARPAYKKPAGGNDMFSDDESTYSSALEMDVKDFLSDGTRAFSSDDDFFDQLEQEFEIDAPSVPTTASAAPAKKPKVDVDFNLDADTNPFADIDVPPKPKKRRAGAAPKPSVPSKPSVPVTTKKVATSADISSLTVPALKDLLREKGLKVSGKKAELIERLQES